MRKTTKLLSVVCALAMIFSMFSMFTIAEASTGVAITASVSENTGKADEEVTVTLALSGVPTEKIRLLQFAMTIDTELFEILPDEDDEYLTAVIQGGLANYDEASKTFSYALTAAKGTKIGDGTIGTMKFKIKKDLTQDVAIALNDAKITDGDGTAYVAADGSMTTESIAISAAPKEKPSIGITATIPADATFTKDSIIPVTFAIAGMTTDKARLIQFAMTIDTDMFEILMDEDDEYLTAVIQGGLANYDEASKTFSYALTAAKGTKIGDGTIGVVNLKVKKDITEEVKIAVFDSKLTDGDGNKYELAADTMYSDSVVIGGAVVTPPATKHAVTVTAGEGGTAKADVAEAAEGDTVTITATPAEGYKVKEITVNGTAIEGNTFVMTAAAAEVVVTFEKDATVEPEKPAEVKEYTIKATTATKDLGKEYVLDIKKNADYKGTAHDKFDVVVQMFDSKGVSVGYMVYADVTEASDISFYLVKGEKATVLVVDDCTGAKIEDSNIIANKISKQ